MDPCLGQFRQKLRATRISRAKTQLGSLPDEGFSRCLSQKSKVKSQKSKLKGAIALSNKVSTINSGRPACGGVAIASL